MKKIYTARNPVDAHLLKGALEGEEIEAIIEGEFLWGSEVPVIPETCPSVWVVNDADYEKALQIVGDFKSQEIAAQNQTGEWKCDNCHETNEGQFLECWQCGTLRKRS